MTVLSIVSTPTARAHTAGSPTRSRKRSFQTPAAAVPPVVRAQTARIDCQGGPDLARSGRGRQRCPAKLVERHTDKNNAERSAEIDDERDP